MWVDEICELRRRADQAESIGDHLEVADIKATLCHLDYDLMKLYDKPQVEVDDQWKTVVFWNMVCSYHFHYKEATQCILSG